MKTIHSSESSSARHSVAIVAWLLIVSGGFYIIAAALTLIQHTGGIHIDLAAALLPFAGIGLLKRRSGWRLFLLCWCWLMFIALPLLLVLSFVKPQSVNVDVGAIHTTVAQAPLLAIFTFVLMAVFSGFSYRVMTRPDVLSYFKHNA